MSSCINCESYTKYKNGLCSKCYEVKKAVPTVKKITKKEQKARRKSTPLALKISDELRKREIPTILELWDGYKHIDIAIPKHNINIEVDGHHHNAKSTQALTDLKRTIHSYKKGYFTLRVPNSLAANEFNECIDLIVEMVNIAIELNKK
jgi:very-short-patch-repair endonuclease